MIYILPYDIHTEGKINGHNNALLAPIRPYSHDTALTDNASNIN